MTEINLKIVIVGDSNVGKSSLIMQYTENNFPLQHSATVGIEYKIKMFKYRNFEVKLQIWDTAGQERFHCITNNFFHHADGILFVFDITNHKTFLGVQKWIKEAQEVGNSFKKILIGNKTDLEEEREVSLEDIGIYCGDKKIDYYEASAKNNINIKEPFNKIVELIFKDKSNEEIIREFGRTNSSLSIISYNSDCKKKIIKNQNKKEICC